MNHGCVAARVHRHCPFALRLWRSHKKIGNRVAVDICDADCAVARPITWRSGDGVDQLTGLAGVDIDLSCAVVVCGRGRDKVDDAIFVDVSHASSRPTKLIASRRTDPLMDDPRWLDKKFSVFQPTSVGNSETDRPLEGWPIQSPTECALGLRNRT